MSAAQPFNSAPASRLAHCLGAPVLAGAALLLTTTLNAAVIVTPNGQSSAEGNVNNSFPFDIGSFGFPSTRYQQVYSASQFAGLAAGGEFITRIAFRPDGIAGHAFSSTLPDIRIDLSTTFDAESLLGDSVSRAGANNDTLGLVTQFTTSTTVPEPSTVAMLGLGSVGLMLLRGRKWARSAPTRPGR